MIVVTARVESVYTWGGPDPRPLTREDLALLRLAEKHGVVYSSDNERKWDTVLDVCHLLCAAYPGQVDWYGGHVKLSERGEQLLRQLDLLNPVNWSRSSI